MQADRTTPSDPTAPRLAGVSVLIVDDSVDATEMLSLALEHKGHPNERAHSGLEAIEVFERYQPDVVLLDIGLPDLDGYTVAARMREINPRAVLIALTGFGDDQTREAVRRCGFAHHLLKPVSWADLYALLTQAALRE